MFRSIKPIVIVACLQLVSGQSNSQAKGAHTLSYEQENGSPTAKISDVSWMSGYWRGEAWGGLTEEIWSEPIAGSMMASFKFAKDGEVSFYEIITMTEQDDSLILKLKHFTKDLIGWEEKQQTVDFKLVRITDNAVYFDGYTYQRISENEMNVYVVIEQAGEVKETKFSFKKVD
jgi:hypothetical protein